MYVEATSYPAKRLFLVELYFSKKGGKDNKEMFTETETRTKKFICSRRYILRLHCIQLEGWPMVLASTSAAISRVTSQTYCIPTSFKANYFVFICFLHKNMFTRGLLVSSASMSHQPDILHSYFLKYDLNVAVFSLHKQYVFKK